MNDHTERRARMRWSVGTPVIVVINGKHAHCLLKDISASGAAVNVGVGTNQGDPAVLLVSKGCSIPSEIVRISANNSGLEFKIAQARMNELDQHIMSGIDPSDW